MIPGRPADAPAIQALIDEDPETYALLEGAPVRPDEAEQLLRELPPGFPAERKYTHVLDGLAVIDLLEGYPDAHTWVLGLIFIAPGARGRGLGTQLIEAICAHVRASGGRTLRLGVVPENTGARRLYERLGFVHVGRRARTTWAGTPQDVDVLERAV